MTTPTRHAVETLAQQTMPIPIGISGMTFLGVTFQDWILLGTGVLLVFQLIVMAPKALQIVRSAVAFIKRKTSR